MTTKKSYRETGNREDLCYEEWDMEREIDGLFGTKTEFCEGFALLYLNNFLLRISNEGEIRILYCKMGEIYGKLNLEPIQLYEVIRMKALKERNQRISAKKRELGKICQEKKAMTNKLVLEIQAIEKEATF